MTQVCINWCNQLDVEATSDNADGGLNTGDSSRNEEQNPQNNNPQHPLSY